jgi:uncharacterized protein YbjT (DUF2867 family)
MKIVVTGSLGHISKPLTQILVQKGHSVTVISSKAERQQEIEALGAKAAIGTLEDVALLTETFTGADVVYVMTPPVPFFNHSFDPEAYYRKLGNNYAQAILQSGVKHVVHLSSIGAHLDQGSGFILYSAHNVEEILKSLPDDVMITFLRPVGLYYNLFAFINAIKKQGVIATNYGADDQVLLVAPIDVATVAAEEITQRFQGRKIRYIASEEISCNEAADILGEAIGKPGLKWTIVSNQQYQEILETFGMASHLASDMVEMNAATHTGKLYEDYYRNRPTLGNVKLKDFAKTFAAVYHHE